MGTPSNIVLVNNFGEQTSNEIIGPVKLPLQGGGLDGALLYSGTGVPSFSAAAGAFYFRKDPAGATTAAYVNPTAGNHWVTISSGGGAAWGGITGTLSAQTDLQNALNAKQTLIPKGITLIDYSNIQDSATITNIPELTFAAAANKDYVVEIFARVHTAAAAAAVIRIKPSYPNSIPAAYVGVGGPLASGSNVDTQPPTNGYLMNAYQSANNADFTPAYIFIDVTTGASAGNITFGFSGGNGAVATTIMAGSKMRVTEF